jgi:hypothetical protein
MLFGQQQGNQFGLLAVNAPSDLRTGLPLETTSHSSTTGNGPNMRIMDRLFLIFVAIYLTALILALCSRCCLFSSYQVSLARLSRRQCSSARKDARTLMSG